MPRTDRPCRVHVERRSWNPERFYWRCDCGAAGTASHFYQGQAEAAGLHHRRAKTKERQL